MKASRLVIAVSIIAVIFGGVWLSDQLGFWRTSSSRNIIKNSGNDSHLTEPHDEEDGDEHGLQISGSTTVAMAIEMGIPEDILIKYLGDISRKNELVKELIVENGYSFGKVKDELNSYIIGD